MAVSQKDIDCLLQFKRETHTIAPFELKQGEFITADVLVNKLNEIISVINSLEEVRLLDKGW
jgi:hypothetical protein